MTWLTNPYRFGSAAPPAEPAGPHAYWRLLLWDHRSDGYSVAEIAMAETASGADLCTGGSSIRGNEPTGGDSGTVWFNAHLAFDDDAGTEASTSTSGDIRYGYWIGYHFAADVSIGEVRWLAGAAPERSPIGFTVQGSDDGTTWISYSMCFCEDWSSNPSQAFAVAGPALSAGRSNARAWRLNISAANHAVVGATTLAELEMNISSVNQAGGSAGVAFSSATGAGSGIFADRAFDGLLDGSHQWSTLVYRPWPMTMGYVFHDVTVLDEVILTAPVSSTVETPKTFTVEYSYDAVNWTVDASPADQTGWGSNEARAFSLP